MNDASEIGAGEGAEAPMPPVPPVKPVPPVEPETLGQSESALPRVRVTAPSTGVAGASTRPLVQLSTGGPISDIAGVYVRSLIRSQLRLAVVFAVGFAAATTLFVIAIVLVPGLGSSYVFGVPASWLLLGVGVYPLTLTVAALYVRIAARNEARYRSLTEDE